MDRLDTLTIGNFLLQIWAFESLSHEQMDVIARLVRVRKLPAGEVLWLQGQDITYFTIVYEGQLRAVRRSSSGAEKLMTTLVPGRHFGLAEMITQSQSVVTIIADKPSRIFIIDEHSLRRELLSHAEICYRLMQTMARSIFQLTQELERVSFENVRTRLARLLLQNAQLRTADQAVGGDDLTCFTSHEELAVKIGVSRETVSRVLADFKKVGLIDTAYRQVVLKNPAGLRELLFEDV